MPKTNVMLTPPNVVTRGEDIYALVRVQQAAGKRVGLVPTMGALHVGHLSLVERSMRECDHTVVSIFVNPKQFSPQEDFSKYPRDLVADLNQLATLGVQSVFTPTADEMYPPGFGTYVDVDGVAQPWEGAFRPGHFRGVTTVVLKLFQIAPADRAYFGRKDYQQALAIRRMVADLNVAIDIVVCPLVRDFDGLALSSRNVFLSAAQREQALVIPRSLQLAREMFTSGERSGTQIRAAMRRLFETQPEVKIDYATLVSPETLAELSHIETSAVALVAARVGTTRLIDNELLGLTDQDLNRTNSRQRS